MKYLIFNAVVFLALGYLIVDQSPTTPVAVSEPVVQKVVAQPEPVVQKAVQEPTPVEPVEPPQKVVKQEEANPQPQKPTSPPPLEKSVQVAKVEAKQAPSRREETGGVPSIQPVETTPVIEAQDELDHARQRSQDLRKMVAEMEAMFTSKLTQ